MPSPSPRPSPSAPRPSPSAPRPSPSAPRPSPSSCLFCRIAAGDIPSRSVHADERTFAFLDIHPLAKGHTLVIPKKHFARLEEMPAGEAQALYAAIHRLVPRLQRAAGAPACTIAFNDGPEAGQEVAHVHCHIVPRMAGDKAGSIHAMAWPRPTVPDAEMEQVAKAVRG